MISFSGSTSPSYHRGTGTGIGSGGARSAILACASGDAAAARLGGADTGLEQRSFISEIILVVIVAVFVVSCAAIVNAVHRGLPEAAALAAAETPSPTDTPAPTPTRQLVLATTTSSRAPTATPAKPTATSGPNLAQYLPVTGAELNNQTAQYTGKKVVITGSVYYVNPQGENTWVQVLTQDNVYVDVNFAGQSTVQKGQQVKAYGTADGKTTVQVQGVNYSQPYLNPGDIIQ